MLQPARTEPGFVGPSGTFLAAASSAHRRAVCFTHSLAPPPRRPLLRLRPALRPGQVPVRPGRTASCSWPLRPVFAVVFAGTERLASCARPQAAVGTAASVPLRGAGLAVAASAPGRGQFVWTLGPASAGGVSGGGQDASLGLERSRVVGGAPTPHRMHPGQPTGQPHAPRHPVLDAAQGVRLQGLLACTVGAADGPKRNTARDLGDPAGVDRGQMLSPESRA